MYPYPSRQLRSSLRVWLSVSIPLFIAAWFLRIGKGDDTPMWEMWRVLITHEYGSTQETLTGLGIYTFILAVPAAAIGWILQFPLCAAWDYFHRDRTRDENAA